jgi:DNA-3-methyladenine glycosylase I
MAREPLRCGWCGNDPLYCAYHDEEWGVPVYDDRTLFEFVVLESAQAGLSWITILRKRENYRRAFARFDAATVARFTKRDVARLMGDAGIVRNLAKIEATVANARAMLKVQDSHGSFAAYQWAFVDGRPVQGARKRDGHLPAETAASKAMAKDMKKRGFKFFGPVTAYAHMQATGMVNDHVDDCFRREQVMKVRPPAKWLAK